MAKKTTNTVNGLGVLKTVYGNNNTMLDSVKGFGKIKHRGDRLSAVTHDNTRVERVDYFDIEGYGKVKAVPYELHFVWEDKSGKIGRWIYMCFPSGTKVELLDKYKNIEDVKIGDSVLTHTGKHQKVTKVFHHHYSGKWATIKIRGNRTISCTAEHRFLVSRDGQYVWVSAIDLLSSDCLVESIPPRMDRDRYDYHFSNKNGSFLDSIHIDEGMCRLFGYYLSEGYLVSGTDSAKRKRYVVHFALNKSEVEYISDIQELMFRYFGVRGGVYQTSENGVRLNFTTQKAYTVFNSLFGKLAWNKSIPSWITRLPANKITQILLGYWRGDGSSTTQGYSISSSSHDLIHQTQKMLLSLSIPSGISTKKANNGKFSLIDGRKIERKHDLHTLAIYGKGADNFGELLGYNVGGGLGANKVRISEAVAEYPIISVEISDVEDMPVYNMEVEQDNSYHVNGVVAHNCTCGSPAGIISYKAISGMMSPELGEYILCCLAHTSSKANDGIGKHADGSSE